MYKVLIVDDSEIDAEGMRDFFPWNDWSCEVVGIASNGLIGYNMALELKPDIILTDVSMPVKDGFEMAEMIKAELDNVFFIFTSCFSSFDYARAALKIQAFSYILKPIKLEELQESISQINKHIKKTTLDEQLNQRLLVQFRQNSEVLLENYLLNTLLGTVTTFSQPNLFDINSKAKYKILIFNMELMEDTKNPYIILLRLKELCKERFDNIYTINFETRKLVLLIPKSHELLSEKVVNIQQSFYDEFKIPVSVYISEEGIEFIKISDYFQKMIALINNNLFEEAGQIIQLDENILNAYTESSSIDIAALHKELFDLLSNDGNIEKFLDKYYALIPQNSARLKAVSYMILCIINMHLMEQSFSLSSVFDDDSKIWNKLANFQSILNIRQWLFNIIHAVQEFLNIVKTGDKNLIIVKNIEKYINSNYATDTALQDSVMEQHISLNYANSLFKKYNNQTIFEFLVSCRIEHAKEMLLNSNLKISEISALAGYSSNTYFSTAFKQYEGISPQQYRENNKSQE